MGRHPDPKTSQIWTRLYPEDKEYFDYIAKAAGFATTAEFVRRACYVYARICDDSLQEESDEVNT